MPGCTDAAGMIWPWRNTPGQAAEKALKAIQISLDREPRQSHSLDYVAEG
jgi:hypothetical protein